MITKRSRSDPQASSLKNFQFNNVSLVWGSLSCEIKIRCTFFQQGTKKGGK